MPNPYQPPKEDGSDWPAKKSKPVSKHAIMAVAILIGFILLATTVALWCMAWAGP